MAVMTIPRAGAELDFGEGFMMPVRFSVIHVWFVSE